MALLGEFRDVLPHHLRRQEFFQLTHLGLPFNIRYVAKHREPRWSVIKPCTRAGVVAPNACDINIAFSWLDPEFSPGEEQEFLDDVTARNEDYVADVDNTRIEAKPHTPTLTLP